MASFRSLASNPHYHPKLQDDQDDRFNFPTATAILPPLEDGKPQGPTSKTVYALIILAVLNVLLTVGGVTAALIFAIRDDAKVQDMVASVDLIQQKLVTSTQAPTISPTRAQTVSPTIDDCYDELLAREALDWSLNPHGFMHHAPLTVETSSVKSSCQSVLPAWQNGTVNDDYAHDFFLIQTTGRYRIRYWMNWDGATGYSDHSGGVDCQTGTDINNPARVSLFDYLGTKLVTHIQRAATVTLHAGDACRFKQYIFYSGAVNSQQASGGVDFQLIEAL